MIMRKIVNIFAALLLSVLASAQSPDYQRRYYALLDRVGFAGVGMETLIENWGKAEPENIEMLQARFYYYFVKSQSTEVVSRNESKYLGLSPILSLKDSTGIDIHYFEVLKYEDEIFAQAMKTADKMIAARPERLDFRFLKANAYLSYERESPDMAMSSIMALAYEYKNSKTRWLYREGATSEPMPVDDDLFAQMMQEYCYSLYILGTPSSYDAFLKLSQRMNEYFPKEADFLGNIGSYHLVVKKDYKTAVKYYDKALKLDPEDVNVINNALLAARRMKNDKLIRKYTKMLQK